MFILKKKLSNLHGEQTRFCQKNSLIPKKNPKKQFLKNTLANSGRGT